MIYPGLQYAIGLDINETELTAVAATHRVTGKVSSAIEIGATFTRDADPDLETAVAALRAWMLEHFGRHNVFIKRHASPQALTWLKDQGITVTVSEINGDAEAMARTVAALQRPKAIGSITPTRPVWNGL